MYEVTEAAIAASASKTTYAGAGIGSFGWFLSNEFLSFVGVCIALVGLVVNIYFKVKEDKRLQAIHNERMKEIQRSTPDVHSTSN
jgi:hypothetical protein